MKIVNQRKKKIMPIIIAVFFGLAVFGLAQVSAQVPSNPVSPQQSYSKVYENQQDYIEKWLKEHASSLGGGIVNALLMAIQWFLQGVFFVASKLMQGAMWLLDKMMTPDIYYYLLTLPAIERGWTIVRDFLNLFFMLFLIFVAISTILRIEQYDAKKYLFQIVMAALLINFSRPIALMIIDISQLAMTFFMNNINATRVGYSNQLAHQIGMQDVFKFDETLRSLGENFAMVVSTVLNIFFTLIFAAMIFVLAAGLVLRIVAFMVLLILSPFAFVGLALPGTPLGQAWRNWIKKMTHWAFFGPVLLFFLWLALEITYNINQTGVLTDSNAGEASNPALSDSIFGGIMKRLIPFAVAMYFLFYGYDVTRSIAEGAGKSITKWMDTGGKYINNWSKKLGKGAAVAATAPVSIPALMIGGRVRDYYQGIKKVLPENKKTRWLTSEGRKMASQERQEKAYQRFVDQDKKNEIYQKKAYELLSKWDKEAPPPGSKIEELLTGGKPEERRAAALYQAKQGNINSADDFAKAMNAVGTDKVLENKIRQEVMRKNPYAAIEHDWKDPQKAKEMMDKAVEAENKTLGRKMTPEEEKDFRSKGKTVIYKTTLDKMKFNEIRELDISFHNTKEFRDYMMDAKKPGGRFEGIDFAKEAAKNLNQTKAEAWRRHGLF